MRRLLVLAFVAVVALILGRGWERVGALAAEVGSIFEQPGRGAATHLPPLTETPVCGRRCGVERWAVKTLSDPQRHLVNMTPVATTIEALAALPRPRVGSGRATPVERTTYVVDAYLGAWHEEADGDLHVVLFGLENQRVSLVAEIPNPLCSGACASGLSDRFLRARAMVEGALARANPGDAPIVLRVTGVGFFDRDHGQIGAAPNGIELHPVLAVEVRDIQ